MTTVAFTPVEAREAVRAYRQALAAGETPSEDVLAGVRAYRARLKERAGQTPRAKRSRKELEHDVTEQVAEQVEPRSDVVTVDARAFAALLTPFKQVVSRRPTLPIFTAVKVATAGDQVFVVGTDLERTLESRMTASEPRPAEVHVAVPFQPLLDAAKAAVPRSKKQDATLTMRHDPDAGSLEVTSGASRRTIRLLDVEDWPAPPAGLDSGAARKTDGPTFAAAAMAAWRSASDDMARPILNGAMLRLHGEQLSWVSTDSYRLTVRNVPLRRGGTQPDVDAVVQRDSVKLAASLFGKSPTVWVAANEWMVLLADETRSLYSRRVEGDFPQFEKLIPQVSEDRDYGLLDVDRDAVTAVLDSLPSGKRQTDNPVHLTLRERDVDLTSREQDIGETSVTLPASWNGVDGMRVGFNPGFLADAFRVLDGPVTGWLKDAAKPAIFRSAATDGLYLLMPVRIP